MINSVRISSVRKKKSEDSEGRTYNGDGGLGNDVSPIDTDSMYHKGALGAVKKAQYSLSFLLSSPENKGGEPGNAIQQVGLTPEASNTKPKVSLVIGPKRSVSCEAINERRGSDDANVRVHNAQGQTYVKKFTRNKTTGTEYLPVEIKTLSRSPRSMRRESDRISAHPEYSSRSLPRNLHIRSKSLPRKSENGGYAVRNTQTQTTERSTPPHAYNSTDLPRPLHVRSKSLPRNPQNGPARPNENRPVHPEYRSQSLPRTRHKSTTDVPSKAPSWYKDLNKKMYTSTEKESLLSRLLESDAKRGLSREIASPRTQRNAERMQSATYEDAPRKLRDGGRSMANQPHRKSLPNLHAASFSFWEDRNKNDITTESTNVGSSNSIQNDTLPKTPHSPKWEAMISPPGVPPDLLPKEVQVPRPKSIHVEYNSPPDFLELRKQELKNRDVEKEREEIREKREKERLGEEQKLREQKSRDYMKTEGEKQHKSRDYTKIEEEKRRLELKEEQLKLKEQLLNQQHEEERRLQKEVNHWRREQEERQLKLKEEEMCRKEDEEKRLLKLKEEELKKKEERLLKQEQELEKLRGLKLKDEERMRQENKEEERAQKLKEEKSSKEIERIKQERLKHELELKKEAEEKELQRILDESLTKPKLPPFGKARYSFNAHGPGELQFKKGAIITVIEAVDENWIEGEYNGNIGIFPIAYVELLDKLPHDQMYDVISKLTADTEVVKPTEKTSPQCVKNEVSPPDEVLDSKYLQPSGTCLVNTPSEEPEIIPETVISVQSTPLENNTKTAHQKMEEELNLKNSSHKLQIDTDVVPSCRPEMEPGSACAKHTFKAETDSELSFKKGDEIVLLEIIDENWYLGECKGCAGLLPANYVKVSKEPAVKVTGPARQQKSQQQPQQQQQQQQHVPVPKPAPENTQKSDEASTQMNGHDDVNGIDNLIGKGDPHKAIYQYSATNEDEIELYLGDIVRVLEKCDDNWYIGTSERTGAFGTFPGNYVVPVH